MICYIYFEFIYIYIEYLIIYGRNDEGLEIKLQQVDRVGIMNSEVFYFRLNYIEKIYRKKYKQY